MVIDANGAIHAAAVVGRGIMYLTNASGAWVQIPLSLPSDPEDGDGSPSIAVDSNGRLGVAFHRGQCRMMGCSAFRILLVMNESGEWSEPMAIAGGDSPSLQLHDGSVHLAYVASEGRSDVVCERPEPVRYMTNASGDWTDMRVAIHGDAPKLQMGSDGLPRIMFGSSYCDYLGDEGIYYATTTSMGGQFALEPIPGTTPDDYGFVDMVLGPSDRPRALSWRFTDEDTENLYLIRDDNGWTSTDLNAPTLNAVSIVTGADGAAHILAQGDTGTWYLTDRAGSFSYQHLLDEFTVWSNAAGIGIDPSGGLHVLFATGGYDRTKPGLWYLTAPGP